MALAVMLTSRIIARGYLRSVIFFPVLVSVIGVGLTFEVLMNPEKGLINNALGAIGIAGPGWLTNPHLAIYSIALVDVWKGVGLATVIYIAGLVSIPTEYYEAARVDGASSWDMFRHITLPLAKPATATVITLSLIGGLRSFDLIWSMTEGRAGLRLGRHRIGDLQAVPSRLLRPLHGRQRGPVRGRHRHRRAADLVAEPRGDRPDEERPRRRHGVRRDRAERRVLPGAVRVHLRDRVQERHRVGPAGVLVAAALRAAGEPQGGTRRERLPDGHRLHQQPDPDRGQRCRHGPPRRDGRLRLAASRRTVQPR